MVNIAIIVMNRILRSRHIANPFLWRCPCAHPFFPFFYLQFLWRRERRLRGSISEALRQFIIDVSQFPHSCKLVLLQIV